MSEDFGSGSLATIIIETHREKIQEINLLELFLPVDYQTYIKSEAWKIKAKEAKDRAGNRCELCNSSIKIHAHHKKYVNLGHEEKGDIIVLCKKCHSIFHGKEII